MRNKNLILIAVVLALGASACQQGGAEEATTSATDGTTGSTVGDLTTAAGEPRTPYTYRLGIFEDTTTDNYWAAQDTLSTVWNSYVLTPTKPALYTIHYPGLEVVPDLSASAEISPGQRRLSIHRNALRVAEPSRSPGRC